MVKVFVFVAGKKNTVTHIGMWSFLNIWCLLGRIVSKTIVLHLEQAISVVLIYSISSLMNAIPENVI
jgi:hypothetical protein